MALEIINNFLLKQELVAKDLIIIGVIVTVGSTLILFLLGKLLPTILKAIKKAVKSAYEYIARINRFRKRKIAPRDYRNILRRLEHGGKLKWYEKEAYEIAKQKHNIFKSDIKKLIEPLLSNQLYDREDERDSNHDKADT